MKVLFFPQNETHIQNFIPVNRRLIREGYKTTIFDSSEIFHQKLEIQDTDWEIIIDHHCSLKKPFYDYTSLAKIKHITKLVRPLKKLIKKFDILIIGSDGAIQRILINQTRRLNRKSFLILDAMISDSSFSLSDLFKNSSNLGADFNTFLSRRAKIIFSRLFKYSNINIYLPFVIGQSSVDKIYCIGEYTKEVLAKHQSIEKIKPWGLPRFADYFKKADKTKFVFNREVRICFFTAAYKWHGISEYEKLQQKDIELLCEIVQKLNLEDGSQMELIIKLHPRDDIENYKHFAKYPFIRLYKEITVTECFRSMNLLITHFSTIIVEGIANGRKVYSLLTHIPAWKFKNAFIFHNEITRITEVDELYQLILKTKNCNLDCSFMKKSKVWHFMAPTTIDSAELIAKDISKINS